MTKDNTYPQIAQMSQMKKTIVASPLEAPDPSCAPEKLKVEITARQVLIHGEALPFRIEPSTIHGILGPPDRIVLPETRAPVGHKDPERHVYDRYGITWLRNHHTGLMKELSIVYGKGALSPDKRTMQSMPVCRFTGEVRLPHCVLMPGATLRDLRPESNERVPEHLLGIMFRLRIGPCGVIFLTGPRRPKPGFVRWGKISGISIDFWAKDVTDAWFDASGPATDSAGFYVRRGDAQLTDQEYHRAISDYTEAIALTRKTRPRTSDAARRWTAKDSTVAHKRLHQGHRTRCG